MYLHFFFKQGLHYVHEKEEKRLWWLDFSDLRICSHESTDKTLSSHRGYQLQSKELNPGLQQELPQQLLLIPEHWKAIL